MYYSRAKPDGLSPLAILVSQCSQQLLVVLTRAYEVGIKEGKAIF